MELIKKAGSFIDLYDDKGEPLYDTTDSESAESDDQDTWSEADCSAHSCPRPGALDSWGEAEISLMLSLNLNIY